MKSVLISIKPEWCELIANGKKTIEVRKTRPKCDTPFKCYIYCTKGKSASFLTSDPFDICLNGKVIGEFVCRNMNCMQADIDSQGEKHLYNTAFIENQMCLTDEELFNYIYDGKRNIGWAWGISDLVIYDKPKELSEFWNVDKCPYASKNGCTYKYHCFRAGETKRCGQQIERPPQSWCYVKEVEE